jgi:rhodanese-related sulfurtransferase
VGEFVMNNLALVGLFLASGTMLVWPELSKVAGMGGGQDIGTLDATRLMNQGGVLVLDIRDEKEYAAGHLPKARHIPAGELAARVAEIAKFKAKPVIVTCKNGTRGGAACRLLKQQGFTTVYQLRGGLAAWTQASLPLEKQRES